MINKTIFLTAGHHRKDSGAVYNGRVEAHETIKLRNDVTAALKALGVKVWNDLDVWDLKKTIAEIKAVSKPDDIICDLHFNASVSSSATGCEVIVPYNADAFEMDLAKKLSKSISTVLNIKDRGVKTEEQSQHTRLGMMRPPGRNFVAEICFISSNYDMLQYDSNYTLLVQTIANILAG